MSRTTRSGAQFSPYELESIEIQGHRFEIIRTKISLSAILQERLAAADAHAAQFDESPSPDDEWEDEDDLSSQPPSPTSSTASSPISNTASSPLSSSPNSPGAPTPAQSRPPSPHQAPEPSTSSGVELRRNKARTGARRSARHQAAAARTPYDRHPAACHSQSFREGPPHRTALNMAQVPVAAGGAWVGRRSKVPAGLMSTPEELEEQDCELIEWNGRDPKLILDVEDRIIAILLGTPEDPEWGDIIAEAVRALVHAQHKAQRGGFWAPGPLHRRGHYFPLTAGVSFGGGQRRPGNLCNKPFFRRLIRCLLRNPVIRCIVGFQSSGLAMYSPKLYRYYCWVLKRLFQRHPGLIHNFEKSIFPAVTFNCGPDAITFDHLDNLNLSHGFCGITCGGHFDHKRRGHIHMKQLKIYIEFPSAASILIPSGCLNHGNTPIQRGEKRHSITQYAASGRFRWAAYGFQSAKALLATAGGAETRAAFDGAPGSRWEWALSLFSKYDELTADRAAVFTNQQ